MISSRNAIAGPPGPPGTLAPPLRRVAAPWIAITFLLTVIHVHLWSSPWLPGALLIALGATAAALAATRVQPRVLLASAGVLLAVAVIAGYPVQRHYLNGRYVFQPGISALYRVWALFVLETWLRYHKAEPAEEPALAPARPTVFLDRARRFFGRLAG